jgi:hypothetical protein
MVKITERLTERNKTLHYIFQRTEFDVVRIIRTENDEVIQGSLGRKTVIDLVTNTPTVLISEALDGRPYILVEEGLWHQLTPIELTSYLCQENDPRNPRVYSIPENFLG